MVYNEDSGRWWSFFDGVEGFDFEPGFIIYFRLDWKTGDPIYRMWGDMPITLSR